MPPSKPQTIVVVGAGPVGLCCALALANVGYSVTIVDSGARGAGWASGGMLGAVYETLNRSDVPVALTELAFESLSLWGDVASRIGVQTLADTIFIARTSAEVDFLTGLASNPKAALIPTNIPFGLAGMTAWRCGRDLVLDPRVALTALRTACVAAGVAFVRSAVVSCTTNQVTLHDTAVLRADVIILATGQGGDGLRVSVPELANISPVKGQMLTVAGRWERSIPAPHPNENAAEDCRAPTVIRAGRIYFIARDNLTIIGATSDPSDADAKVIDKNVHLDLHREAIALCPALKAAPIVESWAGLRPMTPDGLPMVGWSSVEGVLLACGTYRNGWLLAPAIARAIVETVQGKEDSSSKLQSFSPLRFPISALRAKCPNK